MSTPHAAPPGDPVPGHAPLVHLYREGAVAVLELNRPAALNALDVPTARAFHAACQAVAADAGVRAVLLCGAGKHFGVGGDLAAMRGNARAVAADLIGPLHASVELLTGLDAPVVVALQGVVAGGSLSLALACDLAVAAQDTRFTLAYTGVGASCDLSSSWHLPRLLGLRQALQFALLNPAIDADEALRLGLVQQVVAPAALRTEALALASRLAAGPTLAYGRLKRLLRQSFDNSLPQQLDAEREAFLASTHSEDFTEGLEAFFGKRAAVFTGR